MLNVNFMKLIVDTIIRRRSVKAIFLIESKSNLFYIIFSKYEK